MQDDNQLKYLIQLCRAKNIPQEEILKILEENSQSEFVANLEQSWKSCEEYTRVPEKWQEYSVNYIQYIGTLMDPSKCYSTLPFEPNWPNPQVKKKTEVKFKRDLILFVLQEKNKCLKKYLKQDPADLFTVATAVNSAYSTPNTNNKSVKQELDSWNFADSDGEFSSKGPVLVDLDGKKRDLEIIETLKSPVKKMKMSVADKGSTRIDVKDQGSTKAVVKDQGSTRTDVKDQGSTKAVVKDQGSTRTDVKDQGSIKAVVKDQGSTRIDVKDQGSTKAVVKDQGSTRTDVKDQGSTKAVVKDQGSTKAVVKDQGSIKAVGKDQGSTRTDVKDQGSTKAVVKDQGSIKAVGKDQGSTRTDGKDQGSTRTDVKDQASIESGSKDKASAEIDIKDKASKETGSKDKASIESGSKDKVSAETDIKDNTSAIKEEVPAQKISNIQMEIEGVVDLQSLREKVLMSRKNAKKQEQDKASDPEKQSVQEEYEIKDDLSLEEGEISSDHAEEEVKEGETALIEDTDQTSFVNNYGKRPNDSRLRRHDNRYRKEDWRDRNSNPTSGAVEKHNAVAPTNPAMASYWNYTNGRNFNQSNNYAGAMPVFRPPFFPMGYNQQYQPPNPYMQIDANAMAKAQMLANMSQQQSQPMFPQMPGPRSGMNRPPMQYPNANQANFWMMNMSHPFAPGAVPHSGPFFNFAPRPSETSHLDPNFMYENPNSGP